MKIPHVGERAREHPVGQRVDELGRLGERQEPVGHHEPVLGVLPADERLDRVELAVREAGLRLVVQHQLVGLDRTTKLGDEREIGRVVVVVGGVVANRAGVLLLGDVQRDVGAPDQLVDVVGVGIGQDVADTRLDGHRDCAHDELLTDHVAQPSEARVDLTRVVDQDPELVAAETRDRVPDVQLVEQSVRELDEHRVAAVVPERVVDVLESIEVDDRDRERRLPVFHAHERVGDSPLEQPAVRELGQRVVLGEERVELHLPAQPATHRQRDREEHDVERGEPDHEIERQPAQTTRDVVVDRRVRQVELEHTDRALLRTREQRLVDLDGLRTDLAAVVGVGVESRQLGFDLTVRGLDRLGLGFLREAGTVVGEHDVACEVADPEPEHVLVTYGALRDPVQRIEHGAAAQPPLEGVAPSSGSIAVCAINCASERPSAMPRRRASEP